MTTYLDRALQSAKTARKAMTDGDYNAACNRAYYAVFYAAMGLLDQAGDTSPGKTHATLLRRFFDRFVRTGDATPDVGRALTVAQSLRSKADYVLAGASLDDALDAIAAMDKVLEFAKPRLAVPKGSS
jgi:uncharacterized protein (UPF0332 family)